MITKEELKALIEQGDNVRAKLLEVKAELQDQLREVDEALVRTPISKTIRQSERRKTLASEVGRPGLPLNGQDVLHTVATYYGVSVADMRGPGRHATLAKVRHVAMHLTRKFTAESFPEIGRHFGARDHTTVISACNRITEQILEDVELKTEVAELEATLKEAQALRVPTPKTALDFPSR